MTAKPGRFFAIVVVIVGLLLLLSGLAAAVGYLGLPVAMFGRDMLGPQLGQMAGLFLGLVCGGLAVYHGAGSILNRPSRPFKLPPIHFFWIVFALVLGLGGGLLIFRVAAEYLFPPVFLMGAALPTLAVAAWAGRRLGWPVTWRQASLALVGGSTLSVLVAILIEIFVSYIFYLLTYPLWFFGGGFGFGPNWIERLFFSPGVVFFLLITALQAPIPEEFAKALGLPLFGRLRLTSERQVFMIGLISGAGFAILENMLYEGLYAQYNGWSWGGVTLLRGIGAVLHPLCTAIVAVGWFRRREHGLGALLKAYALAVGLHTLWNGGFEVFVYVTGLDFYGGLGPSVSLYGEAISALLIAYLVGLSLGLWWLLRRRVNGLARDVDTVSAVEPAPTAASPRLLAGWAFACALVIVPIGAALGGAWNQIVSAMLRGP